MTDRISARQDPSNLIVSKGPDVCWTPRGGKMVKVPYTSVASLADAIQVSKSVRDNGNYDFQINSRCPSSTGNEPGTGKGVVVPGYCGMALAEKGAHFQYSEGWASVCHGAPAWINRPDPGQQEVQKSQRSTVIAQYTADGKTINGKRRAETTANGSASVQVQPSASPQQPPYNYDKSLPPDDQIGPVNIENGDGPSSHWYTVPPYKICSSSNPACTIPNVKKAVMATQVPQYDGTVRDKGIYPVHIPVMGYIGDVVVHDDGMSVTNETMRNHLLYYGEVTRTMSKHPDGIYLSVEGRGRNFSSFVALINQFGGPALFKGIDAKTKANFDANTGGGAGQ